MIIHFRRGDVIASYPGVPFWAYNKGKQQVVAISVGFINSANQLGVIPKRFYLAGNNTEENFNLDHNVFSGLDTGLLEEVLNVNEDIVRKIQSEDPRGQIVKVQGQFTSISSSHQPITTQERNKHQSGYHEACTFKCYVNIIDNSSYTLYNPRAGRLSTVNNFNLPILHLLKLSARHLVLYKNGIASPSWEMNGHRVMYVIRGHAKVQVVNSEGNSVFEGEVTKGQVLVIPQGFVATKQAGSEGFEAIEFVTNENSMFVSLVGMHSLLRSIPVDVLANAYRLNPNEVSALMFNQTQGPLVNY
ncbi:13S globulin basic chain-like [Lotus japonicus]|uniref:13S globulin basic chain-like n=1 Tax=Lotus japonicus TaxID=34305 RepID=UPI002589E451|nr:13S globulin basic chain-like [Lotus japonicus]